MKGKLRLWAGTLGVALVSTGCGGADSPPQPTPDVFAKAGEVMPRATEAQRDTFERGKAVAMRRFTPEQGLGPTFNVVSCAGCHEKPTAGGSGGHYRDFLLVGDELSDGSFVATGKNGVQTQFGVHAPLRTPSDPDTSVSATRNPIPFFGTGLLAEITDEEILSRADPDDADGDGIRGRANFDRGFVGRFGRKSQTVSVEGFIRGPLFNHLGITTDPLSGARKRELPVPSATAQAERASLHWLRELVLPKAFAQVAAPDEPNMDDDGVPDPELSEDDLFDLVSFAMLLAPLEPDASPSDAAQRGHEAFRDMGCDGCHVEDLRGPGGLVMAYSDLLLHDMGEALADGIVMGEASGRDFRTQPLWGVAATGPYLHDGRADTLDAAIMAHGGEARSSRDAYAEASAATRSDVVAFLESLGGREEASEGLIAPGTPVGKVGSAGGPRRPLSDAEKARFLRGRSVFDRDMGIAAGLGPSFNGDSCRACHFDPVPGGAGPADVDVTRQAVRAGEDIPQAPPEGTMAHRHANDGVRPPISADANVFERRQTPTLLGLGLIDDVQDAAVLALADPDDEDADGISGRAHLLDDGRLGKLGWKAGVPNLMDFAHDAMTNEMGITLPSGLSDFGLSEDDDEVADPELSEADLRALAFFLRELSPPARDTSAADGSTLEEGEQLFDVVGCADCHVPNLPTRNGDDVALYSDLLLHDVADETYPGMPEGNASARELRTPPLWGARDTAPYMHDGRASGLEQAIAEHFSEAEAARTAYESLDASAREALLAFLRSL